MDGETKLPALVVIAVVLVLTYGVVKLWRSLGRFRKDCK